MAKEKRLSPAVSPQQIADRVALFLPDFEKALAEITGGAFPEKTLQKYGFEHNRRDFMRRNYDAYDSRLARARESGAAVLAERMVEITSEMDNPGMARVASQNMQWYLERVHRKTYAPSVDINVTQQISISSALTEARARVNRPTIDLRDVEDAEIVEEKRVPTLGAPDYESAAPPIPDRNGLVLSEKAVVTSDSGREDARGEKAPGQPDIFG